MKKLSVILLSLILCLPLCAQFKGTVYIDSNQSGILDKSDKPLMGVIKKVGSLYPDSQKQDLSLLPPLPDSKRNNSICLPRKTEKPMTSC